MSLCIKYFSEQLSYFVQGYLILEQFIWNMPSILIYTLGILNEMQNIAYINQSSKTQEVQIFRILSRPNLLFNNDTILTYIFLVYVTIFYFSCIAFTFLIYSNRNNMLQQLMKIFHVNLTMKILMMFLNISMHLIKFGLGYIIIEVSLFYINQKQQDAYFITINFYNLVLMIPLIPICVGMFSYNWALDFFREYMVINESNLTVIRILIRYMQIIALNFNSNHIILASIQLILPIISSLIHIYLMQRQKQFIYGIYYKIILFINLMQIIMATECLLSLLFTDYFFQYLWIILTIIPYCYLDIQQEKSFSYYFLNFLNADIECNNYVLFLIIYNMLRNKSSFSNIVLLMYLNHHEKFCQKFSCSCKGYSLQNMEQIAQELFIQELQKKYETQLNEMSFKCSQEQIVFGYLQLLFFRKQYLKVYKYFHIIFPSDKNKQNSKLNSMIWTQSYEIHQAAFKFNNFHKLSVLQVAKSLMKLDIEKQFYFQSAYKSSGAVKSHTKITEFLEYENKKNEIKNTVEKAIKQKIKYIDNVKQTEREIKFQRVYDLIITLIECREQIIKSYQYFSNQEKQNILMFYNFEILNDLVSSYNSSINNDKNDDFSFKSASNIYADLSYIMIQINDTDRITILKKQFKSQGFQNFENSYNFEKMIPQFIYHYHSLLIEGFLSGVPNRFFQQFSQTFIQTSPGLIRKVDIILDVVQINLMSIEMVAFLRAKNDQAYSIILDEKNKIIDYEENLFCDIFGFDKQYASIFSGINIQFLIPKFNILQSIQLNDLCHFDIFFLNPEKVSQELLQKMSRNNSWNQIWNQQYLEGYIAEVELIRRNILGVLNYSILNFKQLKKIDTDKEVGFMQYKNLYDKLINDTLIDESIIVEKPYFLDEMIEDQFHSQRTIQKQLSDNKDSTFIQQQKKRMLLKTYLQILDEDIQQESIMSYSIQEKNHQEQMKIKLGNGSSQQSMLLTLQRLDCYSQFSIVNEFLVSKKKPIHLMQIICFIILMTIVSVIGFSLYLYEIDIIHEYRVDFELQKIKNDVFYPILSFQIIRFSILNYNQGLQLKEITQQEYKYYIEFPKSRIIGSYEFLKTGIENLFNQQINQEIFDDEMITLYYLQNNDYGISKSSNLRSTLNTILNYQFDIQNSYLETGSANFGSPYFYFQYKNFPILYQSLQSINYLLLQDLINKSENSIQINNFLFSAIIVLAFIIEAALIYQNFQFQIRKRKLKQFLFHFQKEQYLLLEQIRLEKLLEQFQKNFNFLTNYSLNIFEMNKQQSKLKKTIINNNNNNNKKKQKIIISKFQAQHILIKFFHFIFCLLILFIFSFKIQNINKLIDNTANLFQSYLDLNIDTLVIFTTREVLYNKEVFSFLKQSDYDNYFNILLEGLQRMENYIQISQMFDKSDYFIDEGFFDTLSKFSEQNLCEEIQKIDSQNFSICPETLSGLLQKGFSPSIINLKNSISTELALTNFTNRVVHPKQELEGVYLLCYSLQYVLNKFSNYFFQHNQEIEYLYSIIIILCLFFSLLYGAFQIMYLYIEEWKKFRLLLKFFYVVPQSAIILDDSLLRNARIFIKNDNLI